MKKNVNTIFWLDRLFLFLVFLFPLFIKTNYFPVIYEIPKVVFLWITIPLFCLYQSTKVILYKSHIKLNPILLFIPIIYLSYGLIASIFNGISLKTLIGNPYRLDGIFTFIILYILSFSISLSPAKYHTSTIPKYISVSSLVPFLFMLFGFFNTNSFDEWAAGYSSNFGNPNFLGGFILISLPFTLFLYQRGKNNKYLAILFSNFLTIIVTRSTIPLILAVLLVCFLIFKSTIKKFYKVAIFVIFTLIFVPLSLLAANKYLSMISSFRGYTPESRIRIYAKAVLAIRKKPIFGWGWSNFDNAFKQIDFPMHYEVDLYVDKPHSHLLESLINGGFPLAIIYLALIVATIKSLKQKGAKYEAFLAAVILFAIHSQTNILSISEEIVFWTIVGVALHD